MKLNIVRLILVLLIGVWGFLWASDYVSLKVSVALFLGSVTANSGLAMLQLRKRRAELHCQSGYQADIDARMKGAER